MTIDIVRRLTTTDAAADKKSRRRRRLKLAWNWVACRSRRVKKGDAPPPPQTGWRGPLHQWFTGNGLAATGDFSLSWPWNDPLRAILGQRSLRILNHWYQVPICVHVTMVLPLNGFDAMNAEPICYGHNDNTHAHTMDDGASHTVRGRHEKVEYKLNDSKIKQLDCELMVAWFWLSLAATDNHQNSVRRCKKANNKTDFSIHK